MTTNAPVRKVEDIPIIKPKPQPRRLPQPKEDEWITPGLPVVEPVKVPVRREDETKVQRTYETQ